jgi:hypothetical protein
LRPIRIVIACAVVLAMALTGSLATDERRIAKLRADATQVDRVDMGIVLHVVRKEPVNGAELIRGLPRMTLVKTHHLGGLVEIGSVPDGWDPERDGEPPTAHYVGRSTNPVVWFASEQQARLILHGGDLPQWLLIEGSEGSGKTRALAMWLAVQSLRYVGTDAEHGVTAPTGDRLGHMRDAIAKTWPAHWYRFSKNDDLYQWHVGPRFQLVTATSRSEAGGSPIQGYTWVGAVSDELQDHFSVEADIQARCRDPRAQGRAKRLCSSTQKDSSEWRTFRETCRKPANDNAAPVWGVYKLLGLESPFIYDAHWIAMRASGTMTEREWRRRILAMDVGPEKAVYFNWQRAFPESGRPCNLAPIPHGAVDVTAEECRAWGKNIQVLAGHDPGVRQHVTEFHKAFRLPGKDRTPRWFLVDEVTTAETTVHGHIQAVKKRARERWGAIPQADRFGNVDPGAATMLVRIDPATQSGEEHPGDDVYRAWRVAGLHALPAAYAPRSTKGTPLKKRQRIDLLNTMFAATAEVGEVRRLFVALVDAEGRLVVAGPDGRHLPGSAAAPMFVKAVETMENDAAGRPEAGRKDADDLSHWPASTAFALWLIESRRLKWEPEAVAA